MTGVEARLDSTSSRDASESSCVVSVIIPSLDAGSLIINQLESLARQVFNERWEVIVADNGTTDGSLDGLDQFSDRINLRVVDASGRRGPAYARNRGVDAARGQWLAFCDADDITAPGWLALLYAARDRADVIAGRCELYKLNSPEQVAVVGPTQFDALLYGPRRFLPFASSCNLLIRRSLYLEVGGFDEDVSGGRSGPGAEDIDFSWRLQLAGRTLAFAGDAVVHYRLRRSLYGVFRQARAYRRGDSVLFERYREAGLAPYPRADVIRQVWWVLSRIPFLCMGKIRRRLWVYNAGGMIGLLQNMMNPRPLRGWCRRTLG